MRLETRPMSPIEKSNFRGQSNANPPALDVGLRPEMRRKESD